MQNITDEFAKEKKLESLDGVYVAEVLPGGAADKAGVKSGDVLLKIDGAQVNGGSAVQEKINSYRPNDKVELTISRDGKIKTLTAKLIGKEAQELGLSAAGDKLNLFGADIVAADKDKLEKLGLRSGIEVVSVAKGKVKDAGIKEGFIITYVNNTPVSSPQDLAIIIKKSKRSILVEGVYPDGSLYYYGIGL